MRNLILAFTLPLALTQPLSAEIADCLPIDNELDRLACYDQESGRIPIIETESTSTSNWRTNTETSAFDDSATVVMLMDSEEPINCSRYDAPGPATLIMRCMENTTALYISTNCHLASGHGGYGNVQYRIDDETARTKEFNASTDNSALGLWRGNQSISFIKSFIENDQLLVRFTPYGQNAVTAEFNISGTEEAITPLREACNW